MMDNCITTNTWTLCPQSFNVPFINQCIELSAVTVKLFPKLMQFILKDYINPKGLNAKFRNNDLKVAFTEDDFTLMSKLPKIEDFTVSLCYKILRYEKLIDEPRCKWGNIPDDTHTEISDDILRILLIRNELITKLQGNIANDYYIKTKRKIESIICRVDRYLDSSNSKCHELYRSICDSKHDVSACLQILKNLPTVKVLSTMSSDSVPNQMRERCARLSVVVIDVLPEMLRVIIKSKITPADLYQKCISILYKFDKVQQSNLWLMKCTNTYNSLDIPVLCKLIRKFFHTLSIQPPTQGWWTEPHPADQNIGDDIERINILRNKLAHQCNAEIDKAKFEYYFVQIFSIGRRIDDTFGTSFAQLTVERKTEYMDIITQQNYHRALQELENVKLRHENDPVKFYWGDTFETNLRNIRSMLKNAADEGKRKIRLQIVLTYEKDRNKAVKILNEMTDDINRGLSGIEFIMASSGSIELHVEISIGIIVTDDELNAHISSLMNNVLQLGVLDISSNESIDVYLIFEDDYVSPSTMLTDQNETNKTSEIILDFDVEARIFVTEDTMKDKLSSAVQNVMKHANANNGHTEILATILPLETEYTNQSSIITGLREEYDALGIAHNVNDIFDTGDKLHTHRGKDFENVMQYDVKNEDTDILETMTTLQLDKEHEGANRISNQFRESNDYNNGSKNEKRNIEKETIADVRNTKENNKTRQSIVKNDISREEENYVRMNLLLCGISSRAVRALFDSVFDSSSLHTSLSEAYNTLKELKSKRKINQLQWNLLFPYNGNPVSNMFDISLMITLLTNLANLNYYCELSFATDTTPLADLASIQYYRNHISNIKDGKIDNNFFNKAWDDIAESVRRVGGKNMLDECKELKIKILEQSTVPWDIKAHLTQRAAINQSSDNRAMPLLVACANNDLKVVNTLLDNKADINRCSHDGVSPLVVACINQNADIVKVLVENMADINQCTYSGRSPLCIASENNCIEVVKVLLANKADINKCGDDGVSPLYMACQMNYLELVKLLLENKPDINKCINTGASPLFIAVQVKHTEVVTCLLDHKADINKCLDTGESPLHVACENNDMILVNMLLSNKADTNLCRKNGASPLYTVSKMNFIEIAKVLLYNKADTDNCMEDGASPLYIACQNNHLEIVTLLLENKANIDKCMKNGVSPFCVACQNNHIKIVRLLLENKADIHKCAISEVSPLLVACAYNNIEIVNILLENKADINKSTDIGMSPLFMACKNNHIEIVKLLIDNMADINQSSNNGATPLLVACATNDLTLVSLLLDNKADINMCSHDGVSPLIVACLNQNADIVKVLVDNMAEVNQCKNFGRSPLCIASEINCIEVVKVLLANKADINYCGDDGVSPLYMACQENYLELVKFLLENKPDINKCKNTGRSPLFIAVQMRHTKVVKCLLNHKADVNKCLDTGESPLYVACENNDVMLVDILLSNKADTNLCNKNGASPLYTVSKMNLIEIAKVLVYNKADVDKCTEEGASPLFIACQNNYIEIVTLLLENKANIDKCMKNGASPLCVACKNKHIEIIKLLLENNADFNKCMNNGISPLFVACDYNNIEIVNILLENKADINKSTDLGESPLFRACMRNYLETVKVLLNNKADINKCDKRGEPPLVMACKNNNKAIVRMLLYNKANINICSNNGVTPLFVACQKNRIEIIQVLLENKADINKCTYDGASPLFIACKNNHLEVVNILLDNKSDVNKCLTNGTSPLLIACQNNHIEIVKLLLDNESDINKCNADGASPLSVAFMTNNKDIVKILEENGADSNYALTIMRQLIAATNKEIVYEREIDDQSVHK